MPIYRVLVSCPLIQDAIDQYADQFARHDIEYDAVEVDQQLDEPELLEIIDRYDGVIAGDDEFTERVLELAERLKVIAKWGIGTDNIDVTAAEERGIDVYNTPGAFAPELGDVVLGYTIMLTRQLHLIDRSVRAGEWICPRGVSLEKKTMGVIGVGNIGSAVAQRAAAHGMSVLGNDVEPLPESLTEEINIEPASKEELLDEADIVSLNCALTEQTHGMIGADELDRLGSDGYLVNTSRGELVVEDELIEALQDDRIAGAALDVFEEEPLPPESPLTNLDNVILGTHNAQNTDEAVAQVNARAVENVIQGVVD